MGRVKHCAYQEPTKAIRLRSVVKETGDWDCAGSSTGCWFAERDAKCGPELRTILFPIPTFCATCRESQIQEVYDGKVKLTIELDREDDGRWIAEALELPGVICYGQTRDEAISNAGRMAISVIADRIAHGEMAASSLAVCFTIREEQLASH